MTASREEMQRMLESVKKVIRARTVDPASVAATDETGHTRNMPHHERNAKPSSNALNAKDNQHEFVQYYYRLICAFAEDRSKYELELPNLTGFDRLVVHALAERCNLAHQSSGDGAGRVMRLRKDALFFQHPDAFRTIDLDEIVAKAGGKESKFHLRHARRVDPATLAPGTVGSYADEDAVHKIDRLRRATDEYHHAVDMGYGQDEMLTMEGVRGGGEEDEGSAVAPLEELLRRPLPEDQQRARLQLVDSPAHATHTETATAADEGDAETRVYDEVCRGCGARARVDYAVSSWTCSKYCAECRRQTIWSLELVKGDKEDDQGTGTAHKKRARASAEDTVAPFPLTPAAEEIDVEADEPISVEDAVEMAAMNDFDMDDINWIRRFATLHSDNLSEHLVFCIDFDDLVELRIFARHEQPDAVTSAETSASLVAPPQARPRHELTAEDATTSDGSAGGDARLCYVVVKAASTLSLSLTTLLQRVICDAFRQSETGEAATPLDIVREGEEEDEKGVDKGTLGVHAAEHDTADDVKRAMEHAALAFRNVSVYGVEAMAVCQLHRCVSRAGCPDMRINTAALQALQRRYGAAHCFVAATLRDALCHVREMSK